VLDPTERARRTIHELNTRHAYDQQAEEEERAAQLALWHDDDQTAQDFRGAEPGGGGVLGQRRWRRCAAAAAARERPVTGSRPLLVIPERGGVGQPRSLVLLIFFCVSVGAPG